MGMFTTPTMAKSPHARLAVRRSSIAAFSPITPKYRKRRMSSEVSRASHTQYAPHIGLPHSEPVTSARNVKEAPIGALSIATTSASLIRHTRAIALAPAITT